MLYALSKMIAVPTVSDQTHRESCRQGAHLLRKLLSQLGATTEIVSQSLFPINGSGEGEELTVDSCQLNKVSTLSSSLHSQLRDPPPPHRQRHRHQHQHQHQHRRQHRSVSCSTATTMSNLPQRSNGRPTPGISPDGTGISTGEVSRITRDRSSLSLVPLRRYEREGSWTWMLLC